MYANARLPLEKPAQRKVQMDIDRHDDLSKDYIILRVFR